MYDTPDNILRAWITIITIITNILNRKLIIKFVLWFIQYKKNLNLFFYKNDNLHPRTNI